MISIEIGKERSHRIMGTIVQSTATAPGRFGPYGGRYVPETLMVPLFELERAYEAAKSDASFQARFQSLLKNFAGRPTPLQFASRLTEKLGGPRIYLKREDLLHTGAHKINNAIGQGLLAVKMGKPRIIAETGAGQHGVASATVAAHLGLECVVYMGTEDMARQALNVARIRIPPWSAIFSPSSAAKRANKSSLPKSAFRRISSPASVAVRIPSASFTNSSVMPVSNSLALKRVAAAASSANTPRVSPPHRVLSALAPASFRALTLTSCRTKTVRSPPLIPSPPASTIPPLVPSTLGSPTSVAPNTPPSPTKPLSTRRWSASQACSGPMAG